MSMAYAMKGAAQPQTPDQAAAQAMLVCAVNLGDTNHAGFTTRKHNTIRVIFKDDLVVPMFLAVWSGTATFTATAANPFHELCTKHTDLDGPRDAGTAACLATKDSGRAPARPATSTGSTPRSARQEGPRQHSAHRPGPAGAGGPTRTIINPAVAVPSSGRRTIQILATGDTAWLPAMPSASRHEVRLKRRWSARQRGRQRSAARDTKLQSTTLY